MEAPEFKLTQTEPKLIAGIDEFNGRWQALTSLAPEQLTALHKVATVESIASSTRIEGVDKNRIKQLHQILLKHSSKDTWHRGEYKKLNNHVEAFDHTGNRNTIK